MREEIEAAALFITKLVNKNLSQSNSIACSSSASSTHSSASSTSSDSPPAFEDQSSSAASSPTTSTTINNNLDSPISGTTTQQTNEPSDKVEQFRQCLTKALYERFHNHWFPEQPTKGQAYRCIRLNEWDRHDITLRRACLECGIDYKDLQLPVELTLWVDPEEVTCRFGENKGSHCLVAKFKDGELKDNNLMNIDDINNIDIEIFSKQQQDNNQHQQHQTPTIDRVRHGSLHNSPDYSKHQNIHQQHNNNNNNHQQRHNQLNLTNGHVVMNNNNNNNNSSYHNYIHQQQAPHHHRSSLGKAAIHHSYHPSNAGNMNPIYYYF